jgi:hypothetical protein
MGHMLFDILDRAEQRCIMTETDFDMKLSKVHVLHRYEGRFQNPLMGNFQECYDIRKIEPPAE